MLNCWYPVSKFMICGLVVADHMSGITPGGTDRKLTAASFSKRWETLCKQKHTMAHTSCTMKIARKLRRRNERLDSSRILDFLAVLVMPRRRFAGQLRETAVEPADVSLSAPSPPGCGVNNPAPARSILPRSLNCKCPADPLSLGPCDGLAPTVHGGSNCP